MQENKLEKRYYRQFAGGINSFLDQRQIDDDESPNMINCDFKGKDGIGNREGYSEIGTADATNNDGIVGMGTLHTASLHQLLRFAKNGTTNVKMEYSVDGGTWTQVADTFAASLNIDGCQAVDGKFYTGNGSDVMHDWSGSAWAHTTNGTIGYFPTHYNKRIWVKDETDPYKLNFSGQWGAAGNLEFGGATTNKLGDFTDATAGWIEMPGEIMGMKTFKNALYVFLSNAIYSISPAATANTFSITLVTNSVGCVSHRSIVQVEEDLMFAANDGVYSLGEVANYTSIRTTNKAKTIVDTFSTMTGAQKSKIAASYFNYKYHLFYPSSSTNNDSCLAYDIRYSAWTLWSNMSADSTTIYTDSTGQIEAYFGHPSTSQVFKMYDGSTDDGTAITSSWTSKSFDEGMGDLMKMYFHSTFLFGELAGTVNIDIISDDNVVTHSKAISQVRGVGGFGSFKFGRYAFGFGQGGTVTNYSGVPLRIKAKEKKFARGYRIRSTGQWRLDQISQTFVPFSHYKFPSYLKIN